MHDTRFMLSQRDNSRGDFRNEDEGGTAGVGRQRGTYAGGSWPRPGRTGRQKTGEHRRKVTIFPRPSRLTQPAHRREYKFMRQLSPETKCREIRILYIARGSRRRGSLSFGGHRGDTYGPCQDVAASISPVDSDVLKIRAKTIHERPSPQSAGCEEETTAVKSR